MVSRFIFRGSLLAAALALAFVLGGSADPALADPDPDPPAQGFNIDMLDCLNGTNDPNPQGSIPMSCDTDEVKTVDGEPDVARAMNIPAGNRDGVPYLYAGPGWEAKTDAQITDGTTVGDLALYLDMQCDGDIDFFGDETSNPNTGTYVPEDYVERTTSWGPGTGPFGSDESYLDTLLPPATVMTRNVRFRADFDTLFLDLGPAAPGIWLEYPLGQNVLAINTVSMHPVWSPAGTSAALVVTLGGPTSPTSVLSCNQSSSSLTHMDGGVVGNPASAGLYARWITETSVADHYDGTINFAYATSCKAIGGTYTDADSDCLVDTDANDTDGGTNPDRDGDLLLDGVEIAWGSDPDDADTDDDGRTDLEEMVGPTQFLTDPTDQDTDDDGIDDGGLIVDLDGDDVPDFPDYNGDGTADSGINVEWTQADGSSHTRVGVKIVGTDLGPDNFGRANFTRTVSGLDADEVDIQLTKGVSTTILGVKAGGGNSGCPMTAGTLHTAGNPETWRVTWPSKCLSNGEYIVFEVRYTGEKPVISTITWNDPGTPIGSEPGPFPALATPRDNCPNIPNGPLGGPNVQLNTDYDSATEHGNGDLYGDVCDNDDDEDGFTDGAEATFEYDPISRQCDNDKDVFDSGEGFYSTANANTLSTTNPDSDGDGVLDARECEFGSNPADPSSTPSNARATQNEPDLDKDGLVESGAALARTEEKVFRTKDILGADPVDPDGDGHTGDDDADSDNDGLSDGCEVLVTGTSPVNDDTDGDGDLDNSAQEPKVQALAALYCNSATDLDGDGVLNDTDTCLTAANAGSGQTDGTNAADEADRHDAHIGNGTGVTADDKTVAFEDNIPDACDGDWDNDLIGNAINAVAPCSADDGSGGVDITYDDDNDGDPCAGSLGGSDLTDDPPSWDEDGDAVIDGWEANCYGGQTVMQDRYLNSDGLDADDVNDSDDDDDGLLDTWEVSKWGTNPLLFVSYPLPGRWDTDGDAVGDCKEAADVNGDGVVDFVGDTIAYAKAALLPAGCGTGQYGKDGDFDINGDGVIGFVGDVIQEAKFALGVDPCL